MLSIQSTTSLNPKEGSKLNFRITKSKTISVMLLLGFLLYPSTILFNITYAFPERSWTFMAYLDADNNLEAAGINDLNEMEIVGSSETLAIVVQIDRILGYDSSNGDWAETRRYYVTKDNDVETINSDMLQNLGELNMGNPETLSSFVTWAIENYPANHYALILWDHGGGHPGVCWDDTNNEDCLTTTEVKQALANVYATTSKKMDVLAFDACLMGTIEVAYQIHNYVDFMVGSEENEPGNGCPYDMILAELAANPTMNPAALATTIVNKYIDSYTDGQLNPEDDAGVTNAALDLTKSGEVAAAVSQLAGAIISDFENSKNALVEAREQAETFHGDFVDLQDFVQLLKNTVSNTTIKAAAQTVIDVIANFVVSEGHGNAHPRAHGVSIYYPRKYDKQSYITLDFADNTMWDEFLDFATNIEATITPVCPIYITQENVTFMDVAVGDVDGDAEYEIVTVGNYTDEIGDVYFAIIVFDVTENGLDELCSIFFSLGYYESLNSVTCADVDQDMLDEIIVSGCYYNLSDGLWYSYIGIFTVESGEIVVQAYDEGYMIFVESLDVADVDGDNFPEIVVSGWLWDGFDTYAYVMVGNNSDVTQLQREAIYQWYIGSDACLTSVAVGDTDADGLAEIVVGGGYYDYYNSMWVAYIAVLNCTQNMFFLQAYDSASNFWINSVDVEDVDGDGLNEIVISGYCWGYDGIYMFISIGSNINPNEIFWMGTYPWIISGDSYIHSIDVEDIEGDGKAEILAVGYYFNIETYAWLNYEAAFSWSMTTGLIVENVNLGESGVYTYSVTIADIDEDEQPEVVTCSEDKDTSKARIKIVKASNPAVTTGTISGIVTDGEEPIAGAIIEVAIPRFSIVASTITSANGSYTITNLPESCYKVSIYTQGKTNQTKTGVIVTAGQTTELNFTLRENTIATTNNMINVEGQTFDIVTISNSTITNFTFNITLKKVSFTVSATADTTGFCNITIPEMLFQPPYTVKIDGNTIQFLTSSNGTHSTINISYTHSTHTVEIIGENVIPEFPTDLFLLLFTCICSIATLLSRKKLRKDNTCSSLALTRT